MIWFEMSEKKHGFWSHLGFSGGTSGKDPTCQCRRSKRRGFNPWVGKIPWRRKWQPTPAFLPGESRGQRNLAATVHGVTKGWKRLSIHLAHTHGKSYHRNTGDFWKDVKTLKKAGGTKFPKSWTELDLDPHLLFASYVCDFGKIT